MRDREPVEIVATSIDHAAEAIAVMMFIGMIAVLSAVWCGA